MPQAYCFRCIDKIEISDPEETTLRNGRAVIAGTCPKCRTKVFRIMQEELPEPLARFKIGKRNGWDEPSLSH